MHRSTNPHGAMIRLRYLRRRGFGIAWKAFLGCSVVLITLQIANSFPRHPIRERQASANAVPHQPLVERKTDEVVRDDNHQVDEPLRNGAFISQFTSELKQHNQLHEGGVKKITQARSVAKQGRPSRENEFYENIIVHFDLKGAPPRVPYFMDLLDLVARSGATGILLEWEDMFPWTGQLEVARNTDAYSMDDVRAILSKAKSLDLDIIPLVQTFGHLEWFLKLEQFRKYRENDAYPQVLCLGDTEAVSIVKDALKQVIDVHKEFGIKYFHIGADEAFEFGVCKKSREWIDARGPAGNKELLALSHLKNIAEYVKRLTGSSAVLAWHDMLKDFDSRIISELGLGKIIEPVIWDYSENIVTMPDSAFSVISTNFPVVWASSAYKGANFPSAKYIDIRHYETNNRAWIETKTEQERKFNKFHGIIITGWQRYDHMAAICEILPMGTPSMVLNVQIALMGKKGDQRLSRDRAARVLGCGQFHVGGLDLISNKCNFTGFTVYSMFQGNARETMEYVESELEKNHHIMGWLSPYSMRHNFTQNWYLNQIQFFISNLQAQMVPIEHALRRELSVLFFQNTVDEFLYLTISPIVDRLKNYMNEIKRLSQLRIYPKRHFKIAP
ncbi:hypothetical protein Y032_0127g1409 [Ancylostoma ceylanicum]|uniref:beta-N-acetylhexosaminidase n=1 Tax=Ancylostoma ceylanicum TaxID=53326 RepID=A0A016T7F0_9BILA|nr:hypothetical protein Y032_0127g1409 [Ancylostoma ceylanicum]